VHSLSQQATDAYEAARDTVRRFINAARREEIVFVRGTTEAHQPGCRELRTALEARRRDPDHRDGAPLEHRAVAVAVRTQRRSAAGCADRRGRELILDGFEHRLNARTRLVAVTHVSNALGNRQCGETHHRSGARQGHCGADRRRPGGAAYQDRRATLDCDFYAFSSHKLYGPTGVGVLYGKAALLEAMPPYQGGGDMIRQVTFAKTTFNDLPYKFEAGTPHIAGVVGLGAAIDYVSATRTRCYCRHEHELLAHATEQARAVCGLRLIGTASDKSSILSFVIDGVHPHDVGTILDDEGIAVRTGHHCAMR